MAPYTHEAPSSRKRKRARSMHPNNKYAESPPDFSALAAKYPTFSQYVSYASNGKPRIDWTDFNATRELTRVLLKQDYGIDWWIPDGQLCPTVPNRANYIHWIEDLLLSCPAPWHEKNHDKQNSHDTIWGFDVGTGANCIYPLLGAALHGWHFVGTDITVTSLEWAKRNVNQNPHLAGLLSVRSVKSISSQDGYGLDINKVTEISSDVLDTSLSNEYKGPPVLIGAVDSTERFDFCMCNPPFFENIEQAGANPHTACGGTVEEMVCLGGEEGFISRMMEDSTQLKEQIHWFTTMVGRKASLKSLIPKLRRIGVRTLRTTEFVQGRTSRWGLAWSFNQPLQENISFRRVTSTNTSSICFMLEGFPRHCKAYDVLQLMALHVRGLGAVCEVDTVSFSLQCVFSKKAFLEQHNAADQGNELHTSLSAKELEFRLTVFEQAPGALLIKGILLGDKACDAGMFSTLVSSTEQHLKQHFGKGKA